MKVFSIKRPSLSALLVGGMLGTWMYFSLLTLLIALAGLFVTRYCMRAIDTMDQPFMTKILLIALATRLIFMIGYHVFHLGIGYTDYIAPDGEVYKRHASYVASLLTGSPVPKQSNEIFLNNMDLVYDYFQNKLPPISAYQFGITTFLLGIFYAVFGYTPFVMNLVNCIFSLLTGILVYLIGEMLFSQKVGKISSLLFLFTPSIFLFSTTGLRDPMIIFLIMASLYLMFAFITQKKIKQLVYLIVCYVIFYFIAPSRFPIMMIPLLFFLTVISFMGFQHLREKLILFLVFYNLIFLTVFFMPHKFYKTTRELVTLKRSAFSHLGYYYTGGNVYKLLPKKYYAGMDHLTNSVDDLNISWKEGLEFASRGVLYFYSIPTWGFIKNNVKYFLITFQNIACLLLFPFVLLGLYFLKTKCWNKTIICLAFIFLVIPFTAISEGNVGTTFRHRDMFTPLLIILGIQGLVKGASLIHITPNKHV